MMMKKMLKPGIRVKRYIFLALASIITMAVAIAKLIDWAGNATPTTWTINYTSGNVGVGVNASYYRNAANTNPATYRYIISNDRVDNNVGIIMMDHVGYRTRKNMAQNYTVYGDLLPQAIIDNNFRW